MNDAWDVRLSASAVRDLDALPARVVPAIIELLYGPLAQNPRRLGKPLTGKFAGLLGARRGAYRVLYELDDSTRTVRVYRVAARSDAYR